MKYHFGAAFSKVEVSFVDADSSILAFPLIRQWAFEDLGIVVVDEHSPILLDTSMVGCCLHGHWLHGHHCCSSSLLG